MEGEARSVGVVKPLLLFMTYLIILRVAVGWLVSHLGMGMPVATNIFITMAAAGLAVQGQFRQLGRLLKIPEKIMIALIFVMAATLFDSALMIAREESVDNKVMQISLAITALFHFFGVWLAISTLAGKFFAKELARA